MVTVDLYIPRTQVTLVLLGKGLVLRGLTFKNRSLGFYSYISVKIIKYSTDAGP